MMLELSLTHEMFYSLMINKHGFTVYSPYFLQNSFLFVLYLLHALVAGWDGWILKFVFETYHGILCSDLPTTKPWSRGTAHTVISLRWSVK